MITNVPIVERMVKIINEHYFLECPSYDKHRISFLKKIERIQRKTGNYSTIKCMLGFYPRVFKSKEKFRKYRYLIFTFFFSSSLPRATSPSKFRHLHLNFIHLNFVTSSLNCMACFSFFLLFRQLLTGFTLQAAQTRLISQI